MPSFLLRLRAPATQAPPPTFPTVYKLIVFELFIPTTERTFYVCLTPWTHCCQLWSSVKNLRQSCSVVPREHALFALFRNRTPTSPVKWIKPISVYFRRPGRVSAQWTRHRSQGPANIDVNDKERVYKFHMLTHTEMIIIILLNRTAVPKGYLEQRDGGTAVQVANCKVQYWYERTKHPSITSTFLRYERVSFENFEYSVSVPLYK